MKRTKAAIVGLGYWGPNFARNLNASDGFELVGLCDLDAKRVDKLGPSYPLAKRFTDYAAMLRETSPELVVVATPVATHAGLAELALEAGAHVLCEKPLTATVADGERIVALAKSKKKHLFVDHTFQYTDAVRFIRDYYQSGALGDLFYVDGVRINLGLFQPDVDVIWDLAPHDLAILDYVIGASPISVQATGSSHNPRGFNDVAYLDVRYRDDLSAHLHLSWLSPVKVRRMIFAGTKSSIIYDDLEPAEKVKIYDHGVSFDVSDVEARQQILVNYRRGDMRAPALNNREALAVELKELAAVIQGEERLVATGEDGLAVVRVLEAAKQSLEKDGARVALGKVSQ